jgi:hypothetical protein
MRTGCSAVVRDSATFSEAVMEVSKKNGDDSCLGANRRVLGIFTDGIYAAR